MSRDHDDEEGALVAAVGPQGCGTPWLLLPGWQQSAAHWTPVARWLRGSGITLLAADLAVAATGCTAPQGTLARTEELVDRLLGAPAVAGARIVVGHSAGAALAVLVAADLPGIRGVIMVEPVGSHFGAAPPRFVEVPRPSGSQSGPRGLYPMADESTLRTIDAAARRLPRAEPAPGARMPTAVSPERAVRAGQALSAVRVPVLVVRGQASALLSAEDARALAAMAPSGRCVTLSDTGHSPHIDRPRACAAQLAAFAADAIDPLST
ncbi:MAG: alpha/beta fold hydrolase, partial [Actinoallomurus sp.]